MSKSLDYLIDNLYLIILSGSRKIVNHKTRLLKKQLSGTAEVPLKPKKLLEWTTRQKRGMPRLSRENVKRESRGEEPPRPLYRTYPTENREPQTEN
jgi:hypothetical protein